MLNASSLNTIEEIQVYLSCEIADLGRLIAGCFESYQGLIADVAGYFINAKGKRIRPLLTIVCGKMLGAESQNLIKIAASVELIHAATLIHDDVIDDSKLRRGIPTVNALWGNQAGILCGDLVFSQAFKLMIQTKSLSSMELLSGVFSQIVEGEINQLANLKNNNFISQDTYFQIIEYKTAKLFSAACEVASIADKADVDLAIRQNLCEFGRLFGLIYQIKDDVADYFALHTGKERGIDFREGKITLPIIILHKLVSQSEKQHLEDLFLVQKIRNDNDLQQILTLMHKYRVLHGIEDVIKDLYTAARDILAKIEVSNQYKDFLVQLLEYSVV
jgi:octaprenyl-diphosphate synthase